MPDELASRRPPSKWNLAAVLLLVGLPTLYVLSYSPLMVLAGPDGIISAENFLFWYTPVRWLSANVPPFGEAVELHNAIWWYMVGRD